jgi:IS5 family transposase
VVLAFLARMEKTGGVQGRSDPNRELLDAAALVGHLVPEGTVYRFLAEHRGRLFPDELFADLFPSGRGRPSVPADVIATVLVLQSLEGLSDRDAVQAVRTDLRWKVAAGLALDDEGFHPTVLTLWRNKLRASERPERIFDAVRAVITETGVLRGKVRRALDSTLLDDAVATQDTVTQLIAAIRRVRRLIPVAGRLELAAHDYNEPGKPGIAWDDDDARQRLITGLVTDAQAVLDAVDGVTLDDDQAAAVGLLALVAGQDVEPGDGDGTWRIAQRTAKDRVISTVDPDTRHMHKSVSSYRDGYKAHVSVEPVTGLICAQRLTPANAPDGPTGVELMAAEPPRRQVLADGAYGSGPTRVALRRRRHRLAIKPWPTGDTGRFGRDDFGVDHNARTATCPAGHTVTLTAANNAIFDRHCNGCPLRARCTTAHDGRTLRLNPHDAELVEARRAWRDGDFAADYRRWRPMVERSLAWLVRPGRRVAYRGTARNRIWLAHRAAAINLRRLLALGLHHDDQRWRLVT